VRANYDACRHTSDVLSVSFDFKMIKNFRMTPIGIIRSVYKTRDEVTESDRSEEISSIEVFKEYEAGLSDIEGFSHIIVVTWMHRSHFHGLKVKPLHFPEVLRGVFATRHPDRPNPIGLSVVQLLECRGNVLKVRGLDMLDGTPVIDIKPYLKSDRKDGGTHGWLTNRNI
jgi:tRNA-Thr(GGU) m(6)t(6)A37 methyltransferase TsaA